MKKYFLALTFFAVLLGLLACNHTSQNKPAVADTILVNGKFYTMNASQPWADAVAIKAGKYIYIGDEKGVRHYQGQATTKIDLKGKMVMPGLNDGHVHPVWGGMKTLFECNFEFSASPDQIAQSITLCVTENPEAKWVVGGQWDSNFFINHDIASPRQFLDAVSGDKAVILTSDSGHDAWVNSKALEIAGIDRQAVDVKGGVIILDKQGIPNGLLLEEAKNIVKAHIDDWSPEQYREGLQKTVSIAHQFGITGVKEAWASTQGLQAFKDVDAANNLNLHVAASIDIKYGLDGKHFTLQNMIDLRDQYRSKYVDTRFVKIFMDGVPTSSKTAAMLDDYQAEQGSSHTHNGSLHFDFDQLVDMLLVLDKAGFTAKIHTAGDRSVRVTLDAIEQVRKLNGNNLLRHELAHAGYINPADMPRFKTLNAVADMSPYLWFPSPVIDSVVGAVGPQGQYYWPIKSLLESNINVVAGSDWPAAVASMNPWVGVEAMISRANPLTDSREQLWAEQAISLEQALKIYTINGARALRLDDKTGSIELQKMADFIVLEHNLFDIKTKDISQTTVLMTWFSGQLVYGQY